MENGENVYNVSMLPCQKISYKKKAANDFKIMKQSAAYYSSMATFNDDVVDLYKYANGSYINTSVSGPYKKLLNPMGYTGKTSKERKLLARGSAVELRNFPIITPIIQKFLGEMRGRSNGYIVQAINSDVVNKRTQNLLAMVDSHYQQMAINMMNEAGMNTGVPTKEQAPIEEAVKMFTESYVDERSIIGQRSLNIIVEECRLLEKRMKLFLDWITAGYSFTYKSVNKSSIEYRVVAPCDLWYMKSDAIDFVEDTEAQVERIKQFPIEKLGIQFPELKEKDIALLSDKYGISFGGGKYVAGDKHTGAVNGRTSEQESYGHHTVIKHIVWKSMVNEPILYYHDPLDGSEQKMKVDEDYELSIEGGDIRLEDDWIDQYWHCYEVDNNVYTTPEPIDHQRYTFDYEAKSCYNGRAFSDRFAENMSIVKLGEDFQKEVNEIRYRVGKTLAKSNDNVLLIDISVIPDSAKFDRDDFMYFMKEFGVAFIDRSQKGADRSFNQYTVLQASQMDAVLKGYELMLTWRGFYWDLVGMNPQRLGKVAQTAGKGTTEMAAEMSSEISEEIFARFEEFEERDIQGLLDLAKFAWRDGKAATYKRGDGEEEFLQVDGEDFGEMQFRVVAKRAGREKAKVKAFKEMLLPIIQNSGQQGVKVNMIASILDMESMSEIQKKANAFTEAEAKLQEAQAQATREHEQQMQQMINEDKEKDRLEERFLLEKKLNNEITKALINAGSRDTEGSGVDVPIDYTNIQDASIALQQSNDKRYDIDTKAQLQREKNASDARLKEMDVAAKVYDSDNKLKIAKENKTNAEMKRKAK